MAELRLVQMDGDVVRRPRKPWTPSVHALLRRRGLSFTPDRRGRVAALLDGYGWEGSFAVVDEVLRRQQRAIDEVVRLGAAGHEPQSTWLAQGWPERWADKLRVTESLRGSVE